MQALRKAGRPYHSLLGTFIMILLSFSCSTIQGRFVPLGPKYESKQSDCSLDVIRAGAPSKDFTKISRIDVHIERTYYIRSGFDEALPELRMRACASGADAIFEIQETSSKMIIGETHIYHVTATGIKYKQ